MDDKELEELISELQKAGASDDYIQLIKNGTHPNFTATAVDCYKKDIVDAIPRFASHTEQELWEHGLTPSIQSTLDQPVA